MLLRRFCRSLGLGSHNGFQVEGTSFPHLVGEWQCSRRTCEMGEIALCKIQPAGLAILTQLNVYSEMGCFSKWTADGEGVCRPDKQ